MKNSIKMWFTAARGPFLIASAIPVIFAGSMAYFATESFGWLSFFLALIGVMSVHAAANISNEYFDYKNKTDVVNKHRTVFSGGSGLLVNGKMTPARYVKGFSALYSLSFVCALLILFTSKASVSLLILLYVCGFVMAYFYSCPPVHLAHRGLGEIVIGLCFGVLPIAGTYFILTGNLNIAVLASSLPITLLIIAVLYINQYPDVDADSFANKRNLVVRFGRAKAKLGYYALMFTTYLSIIFLVAIKALPLFSLAALLTIPLAVKSAGILKKEFENPKSIFPAMGMTILNHHLTGLILTGSILVEGFATK